MLLRFIEIKNFRGIEELFLPLDDLCVLIGENNSGKSSILEALKICLTRSFTRRASIFDEYDSHLADFRGGQHTSSFSLLAHQAAVRRCSR